MQIKEQENQIDPKLARTIELDNLNANSEMTYRICIGKFGAYIEAGNGEDIVKASIPEDLSLPCTLSLILVSIFPPIAAFPETWRSPVPTLTDDADPNCPT